ncbi:hypothetical protein [Bartonella sp. HY761]|uniref:hypothetical protein n=1 Tax=Bartonella sp. HY761 TaxID=2979330 RepID=UPI00220FB822|nr:hypothetical protein [Bartonella sp. HY761]UXN06835.1 hypothetical protein N6A79_02160 [Bartonella sp. HY761]
MANIIQTNSEGRYLVKGGVALSPGDCTALTEDGLIVPLGHPDGIVYAGRIGSQDDPDNTNGQDGDKGVYVRIYENFQFFASDLTKEFDVKVENLNQQVYLSFPETLHTTAGTGRIPIGTLTSVKKNNNTDPSRDPNEIVYEIDVSKIAPIFR